MASQGYKSIFTHHGEQDATTGLSSPGKEQIYVRLNPGVNSAI